MTKDQKLTTNGTWNSSHFIVKASSDGTNDSLDSTKLELNFKAKKKPNTSVLSLLVLLHDLHPQYNRTLRYPFLFFQVIRNLVIICTPAVH